MMPNLGQGGCQAMEDGYVLTNMLRQASISCIELYRYIFTCKGKERAVYIQVVYDTTAVFV